VRVSDHFINERYEVINPDYVLVLSSKLAEIVDVTSGLKIMVLFLLIVMITIFHKK